MKLLFDQNLSPRLAGHVSYLFPGSSHTSIVGLDRASDSEVWTFAHANDFIIVTKDADFGEVSVVRGFPPKVVWLRLGNCTTRQIADALRSNHDAIVALAEDLAVGLLMIS